MARFGVRDRGENDDAAARRNGQDRHGLRASATRLQLGNRKVLKSQVVRRQEWQDDAFDYFDETPEIKYTARLAGNVMSKLRFFVAVHTEDDPEGDPIPANDPDSGIPSALAQRADAELERLKSPFGGRAEIVRMLYMNLEIAAEAYLTCVGPRAYPEIDSKGREQETITEEAWEVKSVDEVQLDGKTIRILKYPGDPNGLELDETQGDAIIRVWERHPRWSYLPDNAMRGVLGIAESLNLLENQVKATAKSHASAGIILLPQEMESLYDERNRPEGDAGDEEYLPTFREAFDDALTEPIENPSSAAAVAPMPLFGPNEMLANVRHIAFARPTDPGLDARIEGRVLRLARGLNYPVETVLGHQQTTFANAAVIDEDKFKDHYEPRAILMCDAWSVGFLQPNLVAAGEDQDLVSRLFVWYDPSALLRGVEPQETADKGFDIGAISYEAWRRVNGWTEDDEPDPVERLIRAILHLRSYDPGVSTAILELLGVPLNIPNALPSPGGAPPGPQQPGGPTQDPNAPPQPNEPQPKELPAPPTQQAIGPPRDLGLPEALLMLLTAYKRGQEPAYDVVHTVSRTATPDVVRAVKKRIGRDHGRQLMDMDRALRTKLQVAAHNSMHRLIERAGNKLKTASNASLSKRQSGETSREMIRSVHPRYCAQILGPHVVAAWGLSEDDLIPATAWDGLHQQWDEWVTATQTRALDVVGRVVHLSVDQRAHIALRQDRDRREAWSWLVDKLQRLAGTRLYQPDPSDPLHGEFDPTASVPVGLIRQAVARAGGATGLQPPAHLVKAVASDGGRDVYVALNNGDPTGGIGTGELMGGTLSEGGAATEGYVWDYGPAFRKHPFEEHEALDGVQFTDFAGPELDASGSWIGSPNYFPGDHDGCACDVTPIIIGPDDVAFREVGGGAFYPTGQGATEDATVETDGNVVRAYSDDQPRDDHGRFAGGGGSDGAAGGSDVQALLARGADIAKNGPMTDAYAQRGVEYRAQVAAADPALVDAVDTWQNGFSSDMRLAADQITGGERYDVARAQLPEDFEPHLREDFAIESTAKLMDTVAAAPAMDTPLLRGLVLDSADWKVGDTIRDPLGSWTSNEAVASGVMDWHQYERVNDPTGPYIDSGDEGQRVLLSLDGGRAIPVSALAQTKDEENPANTDTTYDRPGQVTAQEFLSGGTFRVTGIETRNEQHGAADQGDNYRWKFGIYEGDPSRNSERLPVTVVHVEQTAVFDGAGNRRLVGR